MEYYFVSEVMHYCNVTLKKCGKIPLHQIDYYDFTFVLEGSMVYYADGKRIVLEKNDALFLKPQTMRARDAGTDTVRFVSFNFRTFPDVSFPFDNYMPKCITSNIKKLLTVYPPSHLSSTYHSREKCANMLNFMLYELLDASALKCDNEHVIKILNYIEEHITEKLTLQVISSYVNLSKEYTSYIFKKEMGKTLTDYVNERKMLLAKEFILNREMSLADISTYLGFDNYNYFSRLFKQYLEVTPISLKKNT